MLLDVSTHTPPAVVAIAPQQIAPAVQPPDDPTCREICPVPAPVPPSIPHYYSDINPHSDEPAVRLLVTVVHRNGDEKTVDLLTNQTRIWQVSEFLATVEHLKGYGLFEILETDLPF